MAAVASFFNQAGPFFLPSLYFLGSTCSFWYTPNFINKEARHPAVIFMSTGPTHFFFKVSL